MAKNKFLKEQLVLLWDTNATLAVDARKAADLDNALAANDESTWADFFLTISFDTTAPAAGAKVGNLWLLPSTDEVTARFPSGGDGTVGNDFDPQAILLVGSFEAINPGLDAATEILALGAVPLFQGEQRVVFKNTSGQIISLEWQLEAKIYKLQLV